MELKSYSTVETIALVAVIYESELQKQKGLKMEPNENPFNNFRSYSFSLIHRSANFPRKTETPAQIINRLDAVDEIVDSMTSFPASERMLSALFNKEV